MSRPRIKTQIARTQLTLEAEQKAALFRIARANRMSATALIERWIDEHGDECDESDAPDPPPQPAPVNSHAKPALADERAAKAGRKVAAALRARKPSTGEPTA